MAARIIAKPVDAMKIIFCKTRRSPLLWIAFVHTREKGVRVTSAQRIIAVLDNPVVFFRLCGHFLLHHIVLRDALPHDPAGDPLGAEGVVLGISDDHGHLAFDESYPRTRDRSVLARTVDVVNRRLGVSA